jgi:glycosyltransferase involved in cell wall biosynthesis
MMSACWYLLRNKKGAMVYTIDMDPYSFSPIALLGMPFAVEMHSPKPANVLTRLFFKKATRIIAVNALIKEELMRAFALNPTAFLVEPNGVDPRAFETVSQQEARKTLGLPEGEKIALYAGRFYDWKGMDILLKASADLQAKKISLCLVGGTREEFEATTGTSPADMRFAGSVAHKDMGLWYAAADALIVLGTKANVFSYRYTAPMKMYEYMAAGRPVVAAHTPALRELATEQEVAFYTPDDPAILAQEISKVLAAREGSKEKVTKSLQRARTHTWEARAKRIAAFVGAV